MHRDPEKQITEVGIGRHGDEIRVVLTVNGFNSLVIESEGLSPQEAVRFGHGYIEGLLASEGLTDDMIETFFASGADLPLPPNDFSPSQRDLIKRGALGGLGLAAQGYWLHAEEVTPEEPEPDRSLPRVPAGDPGRLH